MVNKSPKNNRKNTKATGRNYRSEYDKYHSRPEQIKRRSARNKARRSLGIYGKGGPDVAHKNGNPLDGKKSNLKKESKYKNRSFKRTKTARKKNPKS